MNVFMFFHQHKAILHNVDVAMREYRNLNTNKLAFVYAIRFTDRRIKYYNFWLHIKTTI